LEDSGVMSRLQREIEARNDTRLLIAIDGRCASGKTTLALGLQQALGCNVIHMDHFFLPPGLRTEERLSQPGGNIDSERFLREVLEPISAGLAFSYKPFDCRAQSFGESISILPQRLNILEGAYSCHPLFAGSYSLKVFMSISAKEQLERIRRRNGEEAAQVFTEKWIPMEERYFEAYNIRELCDIIV